MSDVDQPGGESGADQGEGTSPASDGMASEVEFYRFFRAEEERELSEYMQYAGEPQYAELISKAAADYARVTEFETGQLVQWKPMMRTRKYPAEGLPAVVVGYLEEPHVRDSDGDLLTEPNDLIIGLLDGKGIFRVFAVASRRLMPWV